MTRVRHGPAFASGMTATGFWLGITMGRVVLGFVTPRIGEKISVTVCYPLKCRLGETLGTNNIDSLGLYSPRDRIRIGSMAGPTILCVGRGSCVPRVFPGTPFPSSGDNDDQTPPAASTCELYRIRCRVWRGRGRGAPVRSGGYRPG